MVGSFAPQLHARLKELPPLVYVAPEIRDLMLDEDDNVREGFLEYDQYLRLRVELPDHQKLILVLGYHLGMRWGEILKLRWDRSIGTPT